METSTVTITITGIPSNALEKEKSGMVAFAAKNGIVIDEPTNDYSFNFDHIMSINLYDAYAQLMAATMTIHAMTTAVKPVKE